jgi:transcriptional regulator with XRE-family HTH domain
MPSSVHGGVVDLGGLTRAGRFRRARPDAYRCALQRRARRIPARAAPTALRRPRRTAPHRTATRRGPEPWLGPRAPHSCEQAARRPNGYPPPVSRWWPSLPRATKLAGMTHEEPDAPDDAAPCGVGEAGVFPPQPPPTWVDADTVPGLVRSVRRRVDMSQRELAAAAKLSPSTIARIESGATTPSLAVLLRLLAVGRLLLVVTDADGEVIRSMQIWDDTRDGADRQFPAHLDLILDPRFGEWWADGYGLARPPETLHRDRRLRDAQRRRSQWEVRVKQFRHDPPPPVRRPRWSDRP